MAEALSKTLDDVAGGDEVTWITYAYLRCFGRNPSESEMLQALKFKNDIGGPLFCRALFNSNEFIHID